MDLPAINTPTLEVSENLFNACYVPYLTCDRRYQLYYGGSSSGKSFFIAQRLVLDMLCGRNYLVLRNTAKTLRASCWNEITKAISVMNLKGWFDISKSEMTITANNNGAQCLFAGLDDVEKVKSITPAKDVLTDIWIEEATEVAYKDFKQLDKRLRGQSRHKKRLTLSFNPVYKTHWIYREFFGNWDESKSYYQSDTLSILKTTYLDNAYLADDDRQAMASETDEYYRSVYVLGNWGVLGDVIFKNWRVQDLTDIEDALSDKLYFGLDFGFSQDPAACLKVHLDKARRKIYIIDEIYERGLINADLANLLTPFAGRHYITADCAEAKSISELNRLGLHVIPCKKGADSVLHGIQWLQGFEITVNSKCQNTRNELTLYQWRKDKDGNSLAIPEDRNNHAIDALRYALESESTERTAKTAKKREYGL